MYVRSNPFGPKIFNSHRSFACDPMMETSQSPLPAAIKRRIVIGQGLYACGALLCFVSTYLSIAFIVLVQLNYAIAPRFTASLGVVLPDLLVTLN